jgi:N-dimethylarginine dimethylaminohydrolase
LNAVPTGVVIFQIMIYRKRSDVKTSPLAAAPMPLPSNIITVSPDYFDVEYVINPHMQGNLGSVDKDLAQVQWQRLVDIYRELGFNVHVLPGVEGLPDMVFCANQSLPFIDENGRREVLMSIMANPQRKDEVAHIQTFYEAQGYRIHMFPAGAVRDFEGMGDALWHPGRKFLYGGYGHRSAPEAYTFISALWNVDIAIFELPDPDFYHLDTCLCMLSETSALYFPGAFTPEGDELLRNLIPNLIAVPEYEARKKFACNATCPDGKHVLIEPGSPKTVGALQAAGFIVLETPTGEFMKSGGSVFCMKMMAW